MKAEDWDNEPMPDPFAPCEHLHQEVRLRTISNGGKAIYRQCLMCGSSTSNALPKSSFSPEELAAMPAYDNALRDTYDAARYKKIERANVEQILKKAPPQFVYTQTYRDYLKSPEWRGRRNLVMGRAKHKCEGCLTAKAEHVHHLTYYHVFDELLFELVAVCEPCHKKCHPEKQ